MNMSDSIKSIKGIGDKAAAKYVKLGIFTVGELVNHYPRDYERYDDITDIISVSEGKKVTVEGTLVKRPAIKNVRNLKIVSIILRDRTGQINVTWFNMPFLAKTLRMGTYYILRGRISRKFNGLTLEQPQILTKEEYYNKRGKLLPIYPLTEGLTNNAVGKAVSLALSEADDFKDVFPAALRKKYNLVTYKKALEGIHFPKDNNEMREARRRLVFDEFFMFIASVRSMKENVHKTKVKRAYNDNDICDRFMESLPYKLTDAQLRTCQEIKKDILSGYVMNRMVQGDVGSGKTVIALMALLFNCANGYQGALMVPTEVLARQHYVECEKLMETFGIRSGLLIGSLTAKEKREQYRKIAEGETDIIIGTHALIEDGVKYSNLGLVVTDEQHRFGVNQRKKLSEGGDDVHVLVMSATPIPRSLALILYGDMDMSVIDSMPKGRLPIQNCVVDTSYRQTAYRFIENQVREGSQVYIICPMVEDNDELALESVISYTESLKDIFPPDIRIDMLYGSMKAKDKNDVMEKFAAGNIDIIVSTTVVEVGINVPNATVIMIENAERFGLAGLHQLRGRVGRGNKQSYCILMSGSSSKEAMERLKVLNESNDGFHIASEDLRLRGPGELTGVRQSGEIMFDLADIYADADILKLVNEAVNDMKAEDLEKIIRQDRENADNVVL